MKRARLAIGRGETATDQDAFAGALATEREALENFLDAQRGG